MRQAQTTQSVSPNNPDVELPKNLGRYQILTEVGRGATAFVYKAYDPELERYIAIKVLRDNLASDIDYQNAFLREAQLAAKLTHPGIVTIFDVGVADSKPYIAMELLEGLTLEQVLKNQQSINIRTVLSISTQLSSALSYAHNNGVIHRDIKPGNIVILKNKKTVKLTDFGIAQLNDNFDNAVNKSDKVLGTPEYMAPEQILGQPMDNRSDLYSFGALIFRLLMGYPPFKSEDIGQLFKQIIKNKPPILKLPDSLEQEKVQDDLNDLVRKLLQKKPAKRFQNSTDVTNELRNIQNKLGNKKIAKHQDFVSLKFRWTAIMAGVVFLAMCISLVVVFFVQKSALSGITFDYGRSIARMIAFESSEPILLDDKVGLNALVTESSQNEQLRMVNVMDLNNVILASSEPQLVGEIFDLPQHLEHLQTIDNISVYRRELDTNEVLFDIEMPIYYTNKKVGDLYLSFSAQSMNSASKLTLISMLLVMMITLFVIFIITFIFARQTSKNYIRISDGIKKLALGRADSRLISQQNDEVSQVFNAFNLLAEQLERGKEEKINTEKQNNKPKKIKLKKVLQEDGSIVDTIELEIEEK